ncbi:discoidin domain-containing protein [Paenibacillus sp. HWE-109]|uniref:discoidin domain-containing protein n=1 Tax=Paenibacillus sp. HWE-109 TaxID=1306526 RepID=UPI001EE0CB3C|nr:discoidin domain-containing protein [Paenibacillus sp. HWE-109]UKS24106.1 discoidin domain-containing protein [Paenibacillus sp. HWE-109]
MTTKVGRKLFASCLALSLVSPAFYGLTAQEASAATTTIDLDPSNMQQSWDGWGTSLAWFANITGGWEESTKNALADALYSPAGLNLNIARYNIGGGENPAYETMRQGGEVPGFSPSPGVWDWSQDANQRWWLQAAKARGANQLEAFSNSAPYYMTVSGSTTGNRDSGKDNLKPEEYDNFAAYMAGVVKHFKENWNIDFNYLSPMNEPNTKYWGFGGGQEGSHYDVASQMKLINTTRAKLDAEGLQSVKIAAMDESILDTFVSNWNSYDETTKENVGKMNTHSYGGSDRYGIRNQAKAAGKPLWMSEVDLGPSGVAHNHDDFEPALALSERIMTDITWLEPKGWVLWQAIESEKNMQKDKENMNWGLLHADFDTQQWWYTKKYYAMQQFSKFIPQGSRFIADNNDNTLAAYDPAKNKIYVVYRNASATNEDISLNMSQFNTATGTATPYVSSATENVAQKANVPVLDKTLHTTVGAKSITTFVIDGASYTSSTVIPQSEMSATASSAQSGEGAEKTLDGNASSKWHSAWDPYDGGPHTITYDLGASYDDVYQLRYLPRQDADWNGVITKYTVEVSTDGTVFNPVAQGTWKNDKSEKTATFSSASARYVRLKADETNGSGAQYASAAEINIMRKSNFTADTQALANAIDRAEDFITSNAASVDTTKLQSLVDEANAVKSNTLASQEDITQILNKLNAEYSLVFKSVETGIIPQSQMTATSDSSASGEGPGRTLDGDSGTNWHTAWDGSYSALPHSITYNLGKAYEGVNKLKYLPRQDADWNGVVTKFEVSVSTDGIAFTKVAAGTWDADKTEKTATFDAKGASYVKFTALESRSDAGKQYASAAEVNIFNKTGFRIDKTSLTGAISDADAFIRDFHEDHSYLIDVQKLLDQAPALLSSPTATQEELDKLAAQIRAEMAKINVGEKMINGIRLFYAPEAYQGNPSSLMLDNNNSSFYESNWDGNGRKYKSGDYIVIDLGQSIADVGKILVTPRQDKANGRIKQFKIYLSDSDLSGKASNGTQKYLDDNFQFTANGTFDATSSSAQTATFKSGKARYVAIQAITTGGDGNTLSTAEIAVSQKRGTAFNTSSLQTAINRLRTVSGISPKVEATIENQVAEIGALSDLTEESIAYYTGVLQDLYNLYLSLGKVDSIESGKLWLDTEGVPIQAHGGGILYNEKNKLYYWYGEDKSADNVGSGYVPVTGVHAYSSKDLYNWKNEGIVLPVFNNPQLGEDVLPAGDLPLYLSENSDTYKTSGKPFDPNRVVTITNRDGDYTGSMKSPINSLSKYNSTGRIAELNALYADKTNAEKQVMYKDFNWDKVVERPKVIYNKKTDKYVMWWHQDGPIAGEYWAAEGGVAISDSPTGPFKFLGTSRLPNNGWGGGEGEGMLRDMTLFVDDDDKGYLIYASEGNGTEIVMQLNDDYTGPAKNERNQSLEGVHWAKAIWNHREAPAIFKQDGVYYMITSGTDGWKPVAAQYHTATNILGPWEDKDNPARGWNNNKTFFSQSTFVLPYRDANGDIVSNKFIFMGDRWDASNLKDSRYVWLPIDVNTQDKTIGFWWHDEWDFSYFQPGKKVTFNSNGGDAVRTVFGVSEGSKITKPANPARTGYMFVGWYQDEALTIPWDFAVNTVQATDITLFAKWEQTAITTVLPVSVVTVTYVAPVLPTEVTVVYNDNATANKSVQWNAIDRSQYAAVGNFTVNGAVDGTSILAVANVTVTEGVYYEKEVLKALIANVKGKLNIAVEGPEVGKYPAGSKQTLQTAIDQAQQVVDNDSATKPQFEQATASLNAALQTFEASVIKEVLVQSIKIDSASDVINLNGGSLQLYASVSPTTATNATVTWAVYERDGTATDKASINQSGVLTVSKVGVVKVVATANDRSGVVSEKLISITSDQYRGGGGGGPTQPTEKEDPTQYVLKDSELRIDPAQDGQTAVTAIIDRERLAQKLADLYKTANSSVLNFEIPGEHASNAIQLPLQVLYNGYKENPGTILTVHSHLGTYDLPLSLLKREDVAKLANAEDASLIVRMDKVKAQHKEQFEQSLTDKGLERVSDIIDYKVILKAKDKEVEITNFGNSFITRVMNVNGVIQDPSAATAVAFDPVTGKLRFVPSVFAVKDGKTEVTVIRNTNSMYTIVENKKTFDDMNGHWAQKDVENLASKMVIDGTTDRTYTPEMQVTRAQFAALLVRGLGLPTETTPSVFTDVAATKWYASEVGTAAKYGLVQGVGEGRFNPDQLITREQMVVMMMKAVALVQGEAKSEAATNTSFADQDQLSDYARSAVADAADKGLVHGKTATSFAPQDVATRAEAAVIIKQAMQYLNLIN